MPIVSSIIPTTRRPQLVVRAVNSALAQTMSDLEVIVVVDGPNDETTEALAAITDRRLRIIQNPLPLGPGGSRNRGVEVSRGQWIAFLDDDDEWMPTKIERQLIATGTSDRRLMVTCLSEVVTPGARYVWPRKVYDGKIGLDEYLFDRHSIFMGEAYVPTPSLLVSRDLFEMFRFPLSHRHEDWDFLLHATSLGNARLITVSEPLVIIHQVPGHDSLSGSTAWRSSLAWIDSVRELVSRRAYSGFCLTVVAPDAARAADYQAFLELLRRAFRDGAPTFLQLAFYGAVWLIPMRWRQYVRGRWYARKKY